MLGIWGTVVEKLSAVDVSWPMFTLTQPLQGGLGANTLFFSEFHCKLYHLSYDNLHLFWCMFAVENYAVLSCFRLMLFWAACFQTDSTSTLSF